MDELGPEASWHSTVLNTAVQPATSLGLPESDRDQKGDALLGSANESYESSDILDDGEKGLFRYTLHDSVLKREQLFQKVDIPQRQAMR